MYFTLRLIMALGVLLPAFHLEGQSLRAYERKAAKTFEARDYPAALAYNQVLLEVDSHRVDALFRGGEAARHLRIFDLAERYLGQIPDSLKTGSYNLTDFNIASAKKGLGKYAEAAAFYRKFIESHTDTTDLFYKRAHLELESCSLALEEMATPSGIRVTQLGTNVNTVYADFAPFRFADKLYFSSAWQGDTLSAPVMRIFAAIQDKPARPISENPSETSTHASHTTLTADGRRMYYTLCESKASINEFVCQIFYRERNYEGDWTAPKRLPRNINLDGFTATQPAAGRDKFLKKEVLFFASDRPGGQGNMDIWCTVIENDGTFGDPFPLPFNTPQDDITPYFHQPSQTLFFSSNGLENLGGYDIFKIEKTGSGSWTEPTNMGYPLNSSYDDLYFTFHVGSGKAYFASNRPGCLCADPASGCKCNDIYEAQISVDVTAWTYNAIDSSNLNGVRVELTDKISGKTDTFHVNPTGNKFVFPLGLERAYRVSASLNGFAVATAEVSTEGLNYFASFERLLYLRPGMELVVRTFNAIDSTALGGTALTLSKNGSGEFAFHQNTNTGNEHRFPIEFGHSYSVLGAKETFSADSAIVSTAGMNEPGTTIYRDLYLSPFGGLPLVLYFDNDQPRFSNIADTTTSLSYEQTYQSYLKRKNAFVTGYASGLASSEVEDAQIEIRSFFKEEVETNYSKLQFFCEMLEGYLAQGKSIEIEVAGYASPLAGSTYNQRLTARRISSLINHFKKFNGGSLRRFFDSGQLVIKRAAKGEEHDGQGAVSDDGSDRRQSVFSPAASRLRRVTITDIRLQQN